MTPPKTLHLTNAYHATSGGIRTCYRALMAEAETRGRPMCLVVPGEHAAVERCGRFGVIYVVAAPRAPGFDRRYHLLSPRYYLGSSSPIARIFAYERPDVVEVCDKYTLCHVARLARIGWYGSRPRPTLVGLSCERMDDNVAAYLSTRAPVRTAARHYLRHVYAPSFDVHVANSAYTAAELREHAGIPDVEVCPPAWTRTCLRRPGPSRRCGPHCSRPLGATRRAGSRSMPGGCRPRKTCRCSCRRWRNWRAAGTRLAPARRTCA